LYGEVTLLLCCELAWRCRCRGSIGALCKSRWLAKGNCHCREEGYL